jgi:hypothetical protein
MDALDEFFRVWCEPEAWCERCGTYPAIHVVVQGDEESEESIVTYVRIWDPGVQAHIAVCRSCSMHHIATLGTPEFHYAPQRHESSASPHRRAVDWGELRHGLKRWSRQLLSRLMRRWRRQWPRERLAPRPYSRPQT